MASDIPQGGSYTRGNCNAIEDEFEEACDDISLFYGDVRPQSGIDHLELHVAGSLGVAPYTLRKGRVYGVSWHEINRGNLFISSRV